MRQGGFRDDNARRFCRGWVLITVVFDDDSSVIKDHKYGAPGWPAAARESNTGAKGRWPVTGPVNIQRPWYDTL